MVSIAASARSAATRASFCGCAEPVKAEPRHQHDARHRIERRLDAADARVVAARNSSGSCAAKVATAAAHRLLERVELAALRRGHDQRPVLGADGVVRRHHAGLPVARQLRAVDEIRGSRRSCGIRGRSAVHAPSVLSSFSAHAPRMIGATSATARSAAAASRRRTRLAAALQPLLGERHHLDHALVGFARVGAEGEDAVLVQDQPFDFRVALERVGRSSWRARSPA